MEALREGSRRTWRICDGAPPRGEPFVVWGHRWLAERIVPRAILDGTEWWLIDNGYHLPAQGGAQGYYSLTRCGVSPAMIEGDPSRLPVRMAPWRMDGRFVLIAMPGEGFGRMMGINGDKWRREIAARVRRHTDRPISIRDKGSPTPLAADLTGAWALVTHSSKVAVDAVVAGVPVIVEPTNPAAPVGSTDLSEIETPRLPDRAAWWQALMAQQFTLAEMRTGRAAAMMERVRDAVVPLR